MMTMPVWRLLHDPPSSAAWNMAADEAMLISCGSEAGRPSLRFYSWNPPAVSVGYFQRLAAEIDQEVCQKLGIDIIRRLTGGRAVLHEQELTYSLVVREDETCIPTTVTESYRFFSRAIMAGLAGLGIAAEMKSPESQRGKPRTHASAACFDAPSHYEITVAGRKLVGSAQVRRDGVLLQHGSILLSLQPERIAAVLRSAQHDCGEMLALELAEKAIGLDEVLGKPIDPVTVANAIRAGFEDQCDLRFESGLWTDSEMDYIDELIKQKYGVKAWNFRR
jgi:lipoate-protein ligase A